MGSKQFFERHPKRSFVEAAESVRIGFAGIGLRPAFSGGGRGDGPL